MNFPVGMACGFGCGFSCGLPAGMAAGRKKTKDEIRDYIEMHGITLHDRSGRTVLPEELLNEAMSVQVPGHQTTILLVIGALLLLALGGFLFLLYFLK